MEVYSLAHVHVHYATVYSAFCLISREVGQISFFLGSGLLCMLFMFFTGIYAGLVGSAMIMSFARAILFFYVCVRAAKKLHNKMLTAVLRVPVRFFDVNPAGKCCICAHCVHMIQYINTRVFIPYCTMINERVNTCQGPVFNINYKILYCLFRF